MQTQNEKERETIPIATRVTDAMSKAIVRILLADGHLNTSDYLRDLIRKDLEKRGLLTIKKEA